MTLTSAPTLPEFIDSSMRSDFRSCPQKYFWAHIKNLKTKQKNEHLIFGSAYAKALEITRTEIFEKGTSLEDAKMKGFMAGLIEYGDFEPPEKSKKRPHRILEALDKYFKDFPPDHDHLPPYMDKRGKAALEHSFALPIPEVLHPETGQPWLYVGRYDYLAQREGGTLFPVDDKTTQAMGYTWSNQWNLRGQLTGYCWAARQYHENVAGAVVRGMCFLANSVKTAECLEIRTNYHIDMWYKQLVRDLMHINSLYEENYWDRSYADACNAWGGCPYVGLCSVSNPEDWFHEYKKEAWNPLENSPLELSL